MERKSPEPGTGTQMGSVPDNPTKRYRPAPAKTFQCRGYGECRMVFSRSEHLARHIRKHTGERPFACHCSKQFSRLDNLRQHAQTVHADKHDQNERMMRDLTTLHASMAAANKVSNSRSTRRPAPPPPSPPPATAAPAPVKQEDPAPVPYDIYQQPFFFSSTTGSRPSTSERLPPLSSIVQQPAFPRPRTARPPSASTSFYPAKPFYPAPNFPRYDSEPSPFYFAPPDTRTSASNSPPANPRKRAFSGPDGPVHSYDLAAYTAPQQPPQLDYDYGSESRPQSRRLSVMELCNGDAQYVDGYLVNPERPPPLTLGAMSISGRRTSPSSDGRSDEGRSAIDGHAHPHGRINDAAIDGHPHPHGRINDAAIDGHAHPHSRINDAAIDGHAHPHGRISPPSRRLTPHALVNGDSYPPRPHSTTFSVSSTTSTSNSPPGAPGYPASQPPPAQTHFAYPPPHSHPHPQPYAHPHPHAHLVGAMSLHPQHPHPHAYTSSPAPTSATSATSYYSPRSSASSSFSPRSPGGHGHGHLAHQQAQAYHALQGAAYHGGHGHGGHGHGHGQGAYQHQHQHGYEYAQGYNA